MLLFLALLLLLSAALQGGGTDAGDDDEELEFFEFSEPAARAAVSLLVRDVTLLPSSVRCSLLPRYVP